LLGISDNHQRLCFALALWNGKDPFLKERLFGLTNSEGNHGEDVKECYYYLDNTPTHSYMKALYKYPQSEFPYHPLVEENGRRSRKDPEFELIDTGVFDGDRYFDVFIEDARNIQRQAFAGMLWNKQFYHYVVRDWLEGDPAGPPHPSSARWSATMRGNIYTQTTSYPCPTSGSIPGLRPGIWHSTASRWA